jgi:tape measure domain-containing protein
VAVGTVVVKIDLDADSFSAKMSGSVNDLKRFKQAIGGTNTALKKSERHVTSWGRKFRDTVIVVGLARHALLNFNDLVLGIPRKIIKANASLEKMKLLMMGLSKETGGFDAISEAAERSVDFVFQLAQRAPFDVAAITDSFVKLKASGIDPTNGSLQAMIDSVAKFGGTSENLKRASIAIQQMSGKGVISMEELRQQLGEAVPNAVMLMARSLDVSVGDLVDKISTGTVEASSALTAMFRQMTLENSGSAARMAESWDGIASRMETRFITLAKIVGDTGFYQEAKEALRQFTDEFLTSNEAAKAARVIGEGLRVMLTAFIEGAKLVAQYGDKVLELAKAFAIYKGIAVAVTLITKGYGIATSAAALASAAGAIAANAHTVAISKKTQAARLATVQTYASGAAQQKHTAIMAAATVRTAALTSAMNGFKLSTALVGGPLGIATLALWGLYEVWDKLIKKGKTLNEVMNDFNTEAATKAEIDTLKASINEKDMIVVEANRQIQSLLDRQADRELAGTQLKGDRLATFEARIAANRLVAREAQIEIEEAREKLAGANRVQIQKDAQNALATIQAGFSREQVEIQAEYERELTAARQRIFADESLSTKEQQTKVAEESERLANILIDKRIAMIAKQAKNLDDQISNLGEKTDNDMVAGLGAQRDALVRLIEELETLRIKVGGLTEMVGGSDDKSVFETYLDNLNKKVVKLGATIENASPELAEYKQMLDSGAIKLLDGQDADEALAKIVEATNKLEDFRLKKTAMAKTDNVIRRGMRATVQVQAQLAQKYAEMGTDNPYLKAATNVEGFRRSLEENLKIMTDHEALLAASGITNDDLSESINRVKQSMTDLEGVASGGIIAKMRRDTIKMNNDLLVGRAKITAEYELQIELLREVYRLESGKWDPEQLATYEKHLKAINDTFVRDSETPMDKLLRDWTMVSENMEAVWANAMSGFSDELTNALVDGEANFKDFAISIGKMILKIQLQKLIAGVATQASGFFNSGGGSGSTPGSNATASEWGGFYEGFATGGIMTNRGSLALRKHSEYGISNGPKMSLHGEAGPEAFVPLPDGRRIPVNISGMESKNSPSGNTQVNVINQTTRPVSAEQGTSSFDGEKFVTSVVLRELAQPGPFRDAVKGAIG